MQVSSFCPDLAVAAPPKPLAPATLQGSWQAVHNQLMGSLAQVNLAGAAVYAYCVHQAFDTASTRMWAQRLAQRLATQSWPKPGHPWAMPQLDRACALAWLAPHFLAAGLPPICPAGQLAGLDSYLLQQAQAALARPALAARRSFVRVVRYLTLRLPAPTAASYLSTLVAQWPAVPVQEPIQLGLEGVAAELLVLLQLHKAGVQPSALRARVCQGIQQLLSSRRAVDFQQQQYSIFPYQQATPGQDAKFGAELTWQRGDLVQSWLLYEAHAVLQDAELAHIAELVGLNTLLRTSEPATTIASPDFYTGAAGVAQRYAQLYQASSQPAYRAAYQFWLGRTQEFVASSPPTTLSALSPATETACLDGLVGISLVLLTAAKNLTINWEAVVV